MTYQNVIFFDGLRIYRMSWPRRRGKPRKSEMVNRMSLDRAGVIGSVHVSERLVPRSL
jgi:hypothetical protein